MVNVPLIIYLKKIINLLKINRISWNLSVPCAKLIKSHYDQKSMFKTQASLIKSPDISKLKEVIIDHRTKIYIAPGADPEEARHRYLSRNSVRRTK